MIRRSQVRGLFLLIVLTTGSGCTAELPECYAEFPVLDPMGNRLEFDIVSVSAERHEDINLLEPNNYGYRIKSSGIRLHFGRELIGSRSLLVELKNSRQQRVSTSFVPIDCGQRVSLRFGESDSGANVGWTKVSGRLSGCDMKGDWWIRAVPMFGEYTPQWSDESHVNTGDSSFWVIAKGGFRHIVIVGKDRYVVTSVRL